MIDSIINSTHKTGSMTALDLLIVGGSGFVGSKLVEAAFKAAPTFHIPFQEIN